MTNPATQATPATISEQDVSDIGDYAYRAWIAQDSDTDERSHCIGMILYRLKLDPFGPACDPTDVGSGDVAAEAQSE